MASPEAVVPLEIEGESAEGPAAIPVEDAKPPATPVEDAEVVVEERVNIQSQVREDLLTPDILARIKRAPPKDQALLPWFITRLHEVRSFDQLGGSFSDFCNGLARRVSLGSNLSGSQG
jgi:hypothetical protein